MTHEFIINISWDIMKQRDKMQKLWLKYPFVRKGRMAQCRETSLVHWVGFPKIEYFDIDFEGRRVCSFPRGGVRRKKTPKLL